MEAPGAGGGYPPNGKFPCLGFLNPSLSSIRIPRNFVTDIFSSHLRALDHSLRKFLLFANFINTILLKGLHKIKIQAIHFAARRPISCKLIQKFKDDTTKLKALDDTT